MEYYKNAAVNWCSQTLVIIYLSLHNPWADLAWETASVQARVYLQENWKTKLNALYAGFFYINLAVPFP